MAEHKNTARAPLRPFDIPTFALSTAGLGFLRPAPGTWGSLPPVLLAMLLVWQHAGESVIAAMLLAFLLGSSTACVIWGRYAEQRFGRKDAAEVVADETAGVCLPALAAVFLVDGLRDQLVALVIAFLLFRLFDIAKPWPMRRLERLPAGWGVLVDDLVAGAYAALIIMATVWLRLNS